MGFLIALLMFALFLVCVLMTVIILFQDNKAGGLAGALGGGAPDSPFGARAGERLSRWTLYLCIAFFVLIFALGGANRIRGRAARGGGAPRQEAPAPPAAPAPAAGAPAPEAPAGE